MGTAAFSVLRLPFIFRGSCQVLPMSDEAVVEFVEVKNGKEREEKVGCFWVRGQGLGTKSGCVGPERRRMWENLKNYDERSSS